MWRHLINRINIFPEKPTCSEFPLDSPVCCHHRTNNKLGTDSPKSHLHSISCREMRCSTRYLSEKLIIIIVLKWSHAPSTHHSHSNCLSCQGMHYVLCQIMGNRTQHSGPIMRTSVVKRIMIIFDCSNLLSVQNNSISCVWMLVVFQCSAPPTLQTINKVKCVKVNIDQAWTIAH